MPSPDLPIPTVAKTKFKSQGSCKILGVLFKPTIIFFPLILGSVQSLEFNREDTLPADVGWDEHSGSTPAFVDPGLFWNVLGYSIETEGVLNFQGQYAPLEWCLNLPFWMTMCSVRSTLSSPSVCVVCLLFDFLIMHGITPTPINRKGNVYFSSQLYVQSPKNIVEQSGKISFFFFFF